MTRRSALFLLPLLAELAGSTITAPAQSDTPKNLQVFPKDTPRQELISHMRNFSFALGVACTYCHGTGEQTTFNLEGVDFALDIKPTKTKARAMLRMVEEINSNFLAEVPHRSELNLQVTCFTCHSGIPLPETIEDRVQRVVEADGVVAAVEDYRRLRRRYHGSASYNFGEQPLVEVASELHGNRQYQAAAAISELNLEFHPESLQSTYGLAEAYFAMGEMEKAKPLYEQILMVRKGHRGAMARLKEIGD